MNRHPHATDEALRQQPDIDNSRARRSPQRHPLKDRGDDTYETPAVAVRALLTVEQIPPVVWEFACGPGAIVSELRATGRTVIATDLVDHGCPDSVARVDFLMEWRPPPGVECGITNPPNKLATEFVEHGLWLCPQIIVLQPISFLGAEKRAAIFAKLARVHVFQNRLPMMHRHGWAGRKNSSQIYYAWFVFLRDHAGPTLLDRISIELAQRGSS
jgi:hypothetical protein